MVMNRMMVVPVLVVWNAVRIMIELTLDMHIGNDNLLLLQQRG